MAATPLQGSFSIVFGSNLVIAASQADKAIFSFVAPIACQVVRIRWGVIGTGGLSAYKARKLTGSTAAFAGVGDTQLLSGDGTTLAANSAVAVDLGSTLYLSATESILAAGDSVTVLASTDATVGNRDLYAQVVLYFYNIISI